MNSEIIEKLAKLTKSKLIETHISWILIGEYGYKIKKPLKFSFLDFTTLDKRKFFCNEEVKLNSRLSSDVYLGVSEITDEPSIDGSGKVIDYAVKMLKIDNRMDDLLVKNKVSREDVERIADIVSEFHKKAESVHDGYGSPKVIADQIEDLRNFRDAIEEATGLGGEVEFILKESHNIIGRNTGIIEKRGGKGMVRDCHGDLHSGNVFFDRRGTRIIDCIEFNKDFRCIDVANDIAFMAMDLDAFGKYDLSQIFVDRYVSKTGDSDAKKLLTLFKCYRANVRAKIAAIEWMQHKNEDSKKRIEKYIKLASSYVK